MEKNGVFGQTGHVEVDDAVIDTAVLCEANGTVSKMMFKTSTPDSCRAPGVDNSARKTPLVGSRAGGQFSKNFIR